MPHFGSLYFDLTDSGGSRSGEGELFSDNPFYKNVGGVKYEQNRRLFGYLSGNPRPGFVSPTRISDDLWGNLVLGGGNRWEYWPDGGEFLPE